MAKKSAGESAFMRRVSGAEQAGMDAMRRNKQGMPNAMSSPMMNGKASGGKQKKKG